MKILTRYLFKDVLYYCLIFVAIFIVVLLINSIYHMKDELVEKSPTALSVILYLIFSLPAQLSLVFPMIGLMTCIFAYGLLAKNREILAMVAAGVSFQTLAVPAFIFGLGLSAFMFWFNEWVVPASESRAEYIEQVLIHGKSDSIFTTRKNLFVKGTGNRFFYMKEYKAETKEMIFPTIMVGAEGGGGMSERIEADYGRLLPGSHYWELREAERWTFNPDGTLGSHEKFKAPYQIAMEENLTRFLSKSKKPEEMNFGELLDHISMLKMKGDKNLQSDTLDLHQKITFPIACLFMALLGFAVVVDVHARRFARGVLSGILIAIGFYITHFFLKNLGKKDTLTPALASWLPLVAFTIVVYGLASRLKKIRG